jgi:predicted transcriptional regulator
MESVIAENMEIVDGIEQFRLTEKGLKVAEKPEKLEEMKKKL